MSDEAQDEIEYRGEPNLRLDHYLVALFPGFSRSQIQKPIHSGEARVNGERIKAGYRLQPGDRIVVHIENIQPIKPEPEDGALDILHQDEDLLILNKPAGILTHPAPGITKGTLVNRLLFRFPQLKAFGNDRPGIVHRLDKETSGVLVIALKPEIEEALMSRFRDRQIKKTYRAIVHGNPRVDGDLIDMPIGRHAAHPEKMDVVQGGREASTEYRVLKRFGKFSLLELYPRTGRTHQIRVHLFKIGHPVLMDKLYGPRNLRPPALLYPDLKVNWIERQALHAIEVEFAHPTTGETLRIRAPVPGDFAETLDGLEKAKQI
jgi:23S rRNA pseudouridine1911/1915/1917 synthase